MHEAPTQFNLDQGIAVARIVRRPLAGADIIDIWAFIAEDSVSHADAWVDRLDGKLHVLATQPLMGRSRDEPSILTQF